MALSFVAVQHDANSMLFHVEHARAGNRASFT